MKNYNVDLKTKLEIDPVVIALGNFDGFHKGHIELIKELEIVKEKSNYKTSVLLFKNHSRDYNQINKNPRLMSFKDKVKKLESLNVDYCFEMEFNEEIKNTSPIEFLNFLVKNINVKYVVVGEDYSFGKSRLGDSNLIIDYMKENGLSTSIIKKVESNYEKISSSKIISLIEKGLIKNANELLGYIYSIKGVVKGGFQRGRELGYPTANLEMSFNYPIADGVYFTKTRVLDEDFFSFTSVGNNPTFENKKRTVETHLFDFNRDIYEMEIEIFFFEKIRDNEKFESVEKLVEQINKDKIKCIELIKLLEAN